MQLDGLNAAGLRTYELNNGVGVFHAGVALGVAPSASAAKLARDRSTGRHAAASLGDSDAETVVVDALSVLRLRHRDQAHPADEEECRGYGSGLMARGRGVGVGGPTAENPESKLVGVVATGVGASTGEAYDTESQRAFLCGWRFGVDGGATGSGGAGAGGESDADSNRNFLLQTYPGFATPHEFSVEIVFSLG